MAISELKKSIKDEVLERIKSGQAKMRPRWHFVLKTALLVAGVVGFTLALLYLASFIIFILRLSGVWFAPAFGLRGIGIFLVSLPWLLIAAVLIFALILEVLVKHYSFAYRKPLLYSLAGIVLLVVLSSFAFGRLGIHQGIWRYSREKPLPVAGPLYRGWGMPNLSGVHAGMIDEMVEEGFRLINLRDEELKVIVSPQTRFPYGFDLEAGDNVMILGKRNDHEIEAFGVRRIDDEMMRGPMPARHMRGRPGRIMP